MIVVYDYVLDFAVKPLHPCFHDALYGVPSTPLRAAIYRGLLLYCNRILNAFHPRSSPTAARSFSHRNRTVASRRVVAGQRCPARSLQLQLVKLSPVCGHRNGSDERFQPATQRMPAIVKSKYLRDIIFELVAISSL